MGHTGPNPTRSAPIFPVTGAEAVSPRAEKWTGTTESAQNGLMPGSTPSATPASFDALVFDMDGVLTDTEAIWDEVRRAMAADAGTPWPDEATTAMMGMSTPEWGAYLHEVVGLGTSGSAVAEEVIDRMAARYHEQLPLLPGAVEAVRRMAAARPIALASSSPRRLIDAVLEEMGVGDLFGATVSTEEVAAGKPAPDGYARACELLGVDPTRCVAVEDSTNGIRSAAAAGLTVVAAPTAFHPPAPEAMALTAAVVNGLDELTEELLEGIARR